MYYNKVDICGINTSKLKVLSDEEKEELLKKAKNGDRKAREELIDGNLRLVLSIIQRFNGKVRDAVWQQGDDYLCDPPHEPQGWYSVFADDSSTIAIIEEFTKIIK